MYTNHIGIIADNIIYAKYASLLKVIFHLDIITWWDYKRLIKTHATWP